MAQQLVTRVDDDLAAAVDALVADGLAANRSEAVRLGLRNLIDGHHRQQVGEAIAEGYRSRPQEAAEGWPDRATSEMIAEEPW